MRSALGLGLLVVGSLSSVARATPYSCEGLPSVVPVAATDPVGRLAVAVRAHNHVAIALALEETAHLDPALLPVTERILAQNLAYRAATDGAPQETALKVIERMALPAAVLETLGDEPDPAVQRWVGTRWRWNERRTGKEGLYMHDRAYKMALAFRPIRTTDGRALLAQMVAFDTAGNAHVTPVVELVELLRSNGNDAPACAVGLDVTALRRGVPGGLVTLRVGELPKSKFLHHMTNGDVLCDCCHSSEHSFGLRDVDDHAAAQRRIARHLELTGEATRLLRQLRATQAALSPAAASF